MSEEQDKAGQEHAELIAALIGRGKPRNRQMLEDLGIVTPEPTEGFDGSVRNSANESTDPAGDANRAILDMIEKDRQRRHGA